MLLGTGRVCPARLPRSHATVFLRPGARRSWAVCQAGNGSKPQQVQQPLKTVDVVALGNLCVDVFLQVPQLPSPDLEGKRQLLTKLTAAPPDQSHWEVGGNCNFMIAAARLGLKVASVGHVGNDIFGNFLEDILKVEKVEGTLHIAPCLKGSNLDQTLICFVLIDPKSNHAFCSRYDFGPWPLLDDIKTLPESALQTLRSSRALFMNGFVFDELRLDVVRLACLEAIQHGAAVFFDPGPRCFSMMEGKRREALEAVLDLAEVVLMTEEEAKTVTGHDDPELAARWVLARPSSRTQWAVVKLGSKGALLRSRAMGEGEPSVFKKGFKVEVQDTVGCGDSFAGAIVMGYTRGLSLDTTLIMANAVGAATAMGRGAGRNVASADKVMNLLAHVSSTGSLDGHGAHAADALNVLMTSLDLEDEVNKVFMEGVVGAGVPGAPEMGQQLGQGQQGAVGGRAAAATR